jgi:hypothetical protein
MLLAYFVIAAVLTAIGWASATRPRSVGIIVLAALVWPLTMMAIAFQVFALEPKDRQPEAEDGEAPAEGRASRSMAA